MAKEKFKMMFNAKNGALLGHLPQGMSTFGLDPDEVKVKTVEYDPDTEVFLGTYSEGKVHKITDVDTGKAYIDEEILNAGVADQIAEEYPIHRQLNIIIDMVNKSDMPNTPEFTKMMKFIQDLREMNKTRKEEYKKGDAYYYVDRKMSELDRKKRMGEA